jgi:hypothetical protein
MPLVLIVPAAPARVDSSSIDRLLNVKIQHVKVNLLVSVLLGRHSTASI